MPPIRALLAWPETADNQRRAKILLGIAALGAPTLVVDAVGRLIGGQIGLPLLTSLLFAPVLFAAPFLAARRRSVVLPSALVIGLATAVIIAVASQEGGLRSPAAFWLPLMPLLAMFLIGVRAAAVATGAAVASLIALAFAPAAEPAPTSVALIASATAAAFVLGFSWLFESARREAEQTIRRSAAENSALLGLIPDLVVRCRADGTVVNLQRPPHWPAWVAIEVGAKVWGLLPGQASTLKSHFERSLRASSGEEIVVDLNRGTIDALRVHTFPVGDEVIVIVHDATEQRRTDRLKDQFIAVVSHELRTPLTSVRGALSLIRSGAVTEEKQASLLELAERNSVRLGKLIDDILDIARLEAGALDLKLELVAPRAIAERSIASVQGMASTSDVRLVLHGEEPGRRLVADPGRLEQVLVNLLSNAIKHAPASSTVAVHIERANDERLRVSVVDEGEGVPARAVATLFEKFTQAETVGTRRTAGSGLGLAVVRELVHGHFGEVGYEQTPQGGACFWVELPSYPPPADAEGDEAARVLIVEDDVDLARVLTEVLEREALPTMWAPSAEVALILAEAYGFAAITIDLDLPGIDGVELLRRLREAPRTSSLPAVFISAARAVDSLSGVEATTLEITDWLEKPFDASRLLASLTQAKLGRPSVLHVDADASVREMVKSVLDADMAVVSVSTAEEAISAIHRQKFDVVVLDLGESRGAGDAVLAAFGDELPPVVVVSSAAAPERRLDVVAKLIETRPTSADVLSAVRRALRDQGHEAEGSAAPPV